MTEEDHRSRRLLFAIPAFRRWFMADAVNLLGSSISAVVLPLLVYEQTGSAALTAGVFALRVVPYLVIGLVAGSVADRADRRLIIIRGNLLEGASLAVVPLWGLFGEVPVPVVYAAALAAATMFVFTDAAVFGALPSIVPPELVPVANGTLSALASLMDIAGPALGALLAGWLGTSNAVWADVATFCVAATLLASIRVPFRAGDAPPKRRLREEVREGLAFVRRHRAIRTLVLAGFGNSTAFGAVLGLTVVFAVEELGVPTGDVRIGLLYSAGAVGSFLAGLAFDRVYRTRRVRWLSPATIGASAVVCLAYGAAGSFPVAAPLQLMLSLFLTTTIAVGITYRMLATPDVLRSRVNVIGRMVAWGGQPVGAALGGILAEATNPRVTIATAAVIFAISSVGAWLGLRTADLAVPPMAGAG